MTTPIMPIQRDSVDESDTDYLDRVRAWGKQGWDRVSELERGLQAEPCFCHIVEGSEVWHICRRCSLLGTSKAKRNADQNCGECHGNGEVEKDGRLGVCLSCFPPV